MRTDFYPSFSYFAFDREAILLKFSAENTFMETSKAFYKNFATIKTIAAFR